MTISLGRYAVRAHLEPLCGAAVDVHQAALTRAIISIILEIWK
jgi:hypothetical protein